MVCNNLRLVNSSSATSVLISISSSFENYSWNAQSTRSRTQKSHPKALKGGVNSRPWAMGLSTGFMAVTQHDRCNGLQRNHFVHCLKLDGLFRHSKNDAGVLILGYR